QVAERVDALDLIGVLPEERHHPRKVIVHEAIDIGVRPQHVFPARVPVAPGLRSGLEASGHLCALPGLMDDPRDAHVLHMVASRRMPRPRPRLSTVALIVALFVWYVSGVEAWRRGNWGEIGARPSVLLTRPFEALRAFVSREGDEHLYHEYAELMVGGSGDLE